MAIFRETVNFIDRFDRAHLAETTPGVNGWTLDEVAAAGSPTLLCSTEDGGRMSFTLTNTSEVQSQCLFHNDVLQFDLANIQYVRMIAQVAAIASLSVVSLGIGSARNDDEDAVAVNAYFKMEGATSTTALVVETDDGTNDNNDIATGETLADVYKEMVIDFTYGLSDVRFYIDSARVASGTTFDMSNITAGQNVQPLIQLSKASGTNVPVLHLARYEIQYTTAYGA